MVRKIAIRNLRNAEFLQFFHDMLQTIADDATVEAAVSADKMALAALIHRIETLFRKENTAMLTKELRAIDERRDRLTAGLLKVCDGYTDSPNAAEQDAARLLHRNLKIRGSNIARMGLNAATATVSDIVSDWQNDAALAAAVVTLHLESWRAALETANDDFRSLYNARTIKKAAIKTPDTIKPRRDEAEGAYQALVRKLEALYVLNDGAEPWASVVGKLNAHIALYKAMLNSRAGRAAVKRNADPPATPTQETEPPLQQPA